AHRLLQALRLRLHRFQFNLTDFESCVRILKPIACQHAYCCSLAVDLARAQLLNQSSETGSTGWFAEDSFVFRNQSVSAKNLLIADRIYQTSGFFNGPHCLIPACGVTNSNCGRHSLWLKNRLTDDKRRCTLCFKPTHFGSLPRLLLGMPCFETTP